MTRIKELRQQTKETQENLAALIGITRGAYANIENGKREPDISTMKILAEHFQVTIDFLLGNDDIKEEPTPVAEDGLTAEQAELVSLYDSAPPALQAAALAVLKSAEGQDKGQVELQQQNEFFPLYAQSSNPFSPRRPGFYLRNQIISWSSENR